MAELVGLHHAALTVTDVERSARWYHDVLGMEEVFSEEGETRRAVIMRIPGAGAVLGVVQHVGAEQRTFDPRRSGLDHLAFTVAQRADMEAWAATLSEQRRRLRRALRRAARCHPQLQGPRWHRPLPVLGPVTGGVRVE